MDLIGKRIWQQAGGDGQRNYISTNIEWDVILNGPGYGGPFPDCIECLQRDGISQRKITDLLRFSKEIQEGDVIVLRLGTSEVHAVGIAIGGYVWMEEFGDIDGWDLQHVRRCRWLWKANPEPKRFDTYALKQGDTTQALNDGPVRAWIESLVVDEAVYSRPLLDLPIKQYTEVTAEQISEYLYDKGVASQSIKNLLHEIDELVRIARWYEHGDQRPSEQETVSYLAIPLLRALGWTPQKMAVEWNNVGMEQC